MYLGGGDNKSRYWIINRIKEASWFCQHVWHAHCAPPQLHCTNFEHHTRHIELIERIYNVVSVSQANVRTILLELGAVHVCQQCVWIQPLTIILLIQDEKKQAKCIVQN